ncbi:MAG: hypothetical protein HY047_11255 [Acidobacteria bacterium]|nr:hypothetical protein [Acidobacteriota bacterium]
MPAGALAAKACAIAAALSFALASGPVAAVQAPEAAPRAGRPQSVASFLGELQRAVDHRDRRAMAGLIHYPAIVMASGLKIPVRDSAELSQVYDVAFTAEMRCLIDQSGVARAGHSATKFQVLAAGDGVSIGAGAVWAERRAGRFQITRLIVPPPSLPPSTPHKPRQVFFPGGRGTASFSGTLVRDDVDEYVLSSPQGQTLRARIDGFSKRDAVLRILDQKSGRSVDARLQKGLRQWSGTIPADADYRIDVVRLAPYCDPPLTYVLRITVQ